MLDLSSQNKSTVIYFPDSIIHDPGTLTSLCLFHDQIILFFPDDPVETITLLKKRYDSKKPLLRKKLMAYRYFLSGPLKVLEPEGILTVVTPKSFKNMFPLAGNFEVASRMLQDIARTTFGKEYSNKWTSIVLRELLRTVMALGTAKRYKLPLVTDKHSLPHNTFQYSGQEVALLSDILARSAITTLALPNLRTTDPEDILRAKDVLKNELIQFRIGVLDLTYLLRQNVNNRSDLIEITKEAEVIVNTKIKASLLDLENRISQSNDSRVKRLLFASSKIAFDIVKLFLPGGVPEKIIAGAKSLFQLATTIDEKTKPESQIAGFIYGLKTHY
jgi:hypothetical protein